uniref:SCP domain-containing protein n=1 Tax=Syphacia muris TaxID=451379 RepID=A0A0N5AF65_9BILA
MIQKLVLLFIVLLVASADSEDYSPSYNDYHLASLLTNTVTNYQRKAWHRWKTKEAAAAAAANQRFAPFIIGADFYGPDYKIPTNGSYIGVGRIYRELEKPG